MHKVAAHPIILLLMLAMTGTLLAQNSTPETPEVRARAAMDHGDYLLAIPLLQEARQVGRGPVGGLKAVVEQDF